MLTNAVIESRVHAIKNYDKFTRVLIFGDKETKSYLNGVAFKQAHEFFVNRKLDGGTVVRMKGGFDISVYESPSGEKVNSIVFKIFEVSMVSVSKEISPADDINDDLPF